jgi:hypothetical protein
METLRTLLASLGTPGAVRNAEHALLARQAEDRALTAFAQRMADLDNPALAAPAA